MLPSFWRSPSPPGWVYLPWQLLGQCWPLYWDASWILHQEAADWERLREQALKGINMTAMQNSSTRGHMSQTVVPDGGTTVTYLQLQLWPNHLVQCVSSSLVSAKRLVISLRGWEVLLQFTKSICMWLDQQIPAATLWQRLAIVDSKALRTCVRAPSKRQKC